MIINIGVKDLGLANDIVVKLVTEDIDYTTYMGRRNMITFDCERVIIKKEDNEEFIDIHINGKKNYLIRIDYKDIDYIDVWGEWYGLRYYQLLSGVIHRDNRHYRLISLIIHHSCKGEYKRMKKATIIRVIGLLDKVLKNELSEMNKLDSRRLNPIKINGEVYDNPEEVIEAYGIGIITKSQKEVALKKFERPRIITAIEHEENADLLHSLMTDLHQLVLKMEEENKDEI